MENKNYNPKEVVMAYINALDGQNYEDALNYLNEGVRIRGPAGESFGKPIEFVEMLRKYHGKYDVKKIFADQDEVSVWYDLNTTLAKVFMASWYQVKDGQIVSIQTLFDPKAFGPAQQK